MQVRLQKSNQLNDRLTDQFNTIKQLLENKKYDKAADLMFLLGAKNLAIFQERYPEIQQILRQEEFNPFWHEILINLTLPQHTDFQFREPSNLSIADFVSGYQYFLLAIEYKQKKQISEYKKYLQLALDFNSIHALQTQLHELISFVCEDNLDYCKNLKHALKEMEEVASIHKSPGCLLLVKGYIFLARAAQEIEDLKITRDAFINISKYLYLAEQYESYFEDDLHNAYFGQGIILSTSFQLASFDEIREFCSEFAPKKHAKQLQKFAEASVQKEISDLNEWNVYNPHL